MKNKGKWLVRKCLTCVFIMTLCLIIWPTSDVQAIINTEGKVISVNKELVSSTWINYARNIDTDGLFRDDFLARTGADQYTLVVGVQDGCGWCSRLIEDLCGLEASSVLLSSNVQMMVVNIADSSSKDATRKYLASLEGVSNLSRYSNGIGVFSWSLNQVGATGERSANTPGVMLFQGDGNTLILKGYSFGSIRAKDYEDALKTHMNISGDEDNDLEPELVEGGLYRFSRPDGKDWLITCNKEEIFNLLRAGWKNDGRVGNVAPWGQGTAVYRFHNRYTNDRMYSDNAEEIENYEAAEVQGWKNEGPAFYYNPAGQIEVTRYATPDGLHIWSTDSGEQKSFDKAGWHREGQAFRLDWVN